ncbi:hypothetical protein DERP_012417 [Dermatophagoides pteronyssinus]|uniref:GAG-pre-integrase domain-containing protein n=1 Tax=Dermatophagoides pteronyssinus TaxID=6956 RepID=A0ABQ8IUP4_DERPT|nr:hypothetical protein DERP_012417 [Dermatophagoides pteronyssinus]
MATNDGETPGPFDKLVNFMEKLNERISRIENERVDNQQLIGQSTNPPVIRQKSNHENYVLSQIVKYDGKNLKHWLSSVKAAFKSCGYSHFLESELEATHPDYHLYQNCLGTISLTFVPEKFEIIEHCKSVYQVWKHMSQVEKDTYATAVRKQTELMSCKYNGGSLRSWLETIIAKFESIESEWCTYSDKHRCVIVMSMLRSMGNFEQLADRIMMNQKGTMNDIMNEFIEHDEKQKSQSIITNIVSREKVQLVKKKQFKSDVKCSFVSKMVETSTPSSSNANDKGRKFVLKKNGQILLLTTNFRDDVSFIANIDENNLWTINSKPKENKIFNLWHKRLAHCGQKTIKRIRKIVSQVDKNIETCEDCMLNKSVSAPHNHPMKYNVKPFELLHVDLWQAPVSSYQGSKYGMLIVDHNTRFVFGIPIASKSDAADKLIKFIEQNEKRLKFRVMLNSAKPHRNNYGQETMCSAIYVINTWIRKDGKSPYEKL